jgi:hypothetical protein
MRVRPAAVLAWSWFALVVVLDIAFDVALFRLNRQVEGAPFPVDIGDPTALAYLLLGALIVSSRPGNVVGLLLMLTGTGFAVPVFPLVEALVAVGSDPVGPVWTALAFSTNYLGLLLEIPILYLLLLFPNGRLPGPRWRWLSRLGIVLILLQLILVALLPELHVGREVTLANPMSPFTGALAERYQAFVFTYAALPLGAATLLFGLGCAVAPFVRYRRAGAVERMQIRWLLYAGALFLIAFVVIRIIGFDDAGVPVFVLWILGNLAVPVAVAIAVLRHRLFDIDVIIRRTLQYGVLTTILAGLYFGSVLLFQTLLQPLRRRVQRFLDRRFYRSKVDAERALARFAATVRDEVELSHIGGALSEVVQETVQPVWMGLWLSPGAAEGSRGEER